jgi:hypothetical protein
MLDVDVFFNDIDIARFRRAKELSEIKRSFVQFGLSDPFGIASKAVVVLSYANWEGFYNDCIHIYIGFLREMGGKVRDNNWMLLLSVLHADLESVRDRNHSFDSRQQFVANLRGRLDCGFDAVEVTHIEARSSLDYARLTQTYQLLDFDLSSIQSSRNRLDKELVGWRHAVAHGDSPDLTVMDVSSHVDFTSKLLMLVSDRFQYAMLDRV